MRLRIIKNLTSNEQQAILAYIVLFNMSSDEAVSHVPKVSSNFVTNELKQSLENYC
jgi:hypothetical protein